MGKPRVSVISESETGRNTRFRDNQTGDTMTIPEFVRKIENGKYPDYYVRIINGIKTPVSKPDGESSNNLD